MGVFESDSGCVKGLIGGKLIGGIRVCISLCCVLFGSCLFAGELLWWFWGVVCNLVCGLVVEPD